MPDLFIASDLGPSDPVAVVDYSVEEDASLCAGTGLVNLVQFQDVLRRNDLAGFLRESRAPLVLRQAIWECALREWPTFVTSLGARRTALRDEILGSSREWADQLDHDGAPDPRTRSSHSAIVVRIQKERAAAEVAFVNLLAECAGADGALAALDPLVQRARARNASASILGRPPRWVAVDLRAILFECDLTDAQWSTVESLLGPFEASRASLLLARHQAEWHALGADGADRANDWNRVESFERRIRQETRTAMKCIRDALGKDAGDRLHLRAAGEAYPELAPTLLALVEVLESTEHQGPPAASWQAWREDLEATLPVALEELDETSERSGFLWIRSDSPALEKSLQVFRARLDAVAARRPPT